MELPTTLRDLVVLALVPGGAGSVFSFLEGNFAWFKAFSSGQKALFISAITAVFGIVYYFVTQELDPATFAKFDKYYIAFVPYLAAIIGQWTFHSTVNKAREKANADG